MVWPRLDSALFATGAAAARDLLTVRSGLLLCILLALAGLLLAGDYGSNPDELRRRQNAVDYLDYIGSGDARFLPPYPDRLFGISFELPLLLAEGALGLEDSYYIHWLRSALTHLFFILGGYCCYRLAYRLFDNRLAAVFALLIFLLHPRIYAHSFFNSRDPVFLSMLAIALYLLEGAFRRNTTGAFLLAGAAVGILTDLRIMGLLLIPAVVVLRGIDLISAGTGAERKVILMSGGGFVMAAALTLYAVTPYAWRQPLEYLAGSLFLTVNHPFMLTELFQGRVYPSGELPLHYIPTWFAITTPPPLLLLGGVGAAVVAARGIARPAALFRNTPLRFGGLLVAGFLLPAVAVALLNANTFDDWRHLYFIYAPFSLLAGGGLCWIVTTLARQRRMTAGAYGLAGLGLGLILLQMAQLHPLQQVYFNFLVDRTTPDYLRTRYDLDHWQLAVREGLEYVRRIHPQEPLALRVNPPRLVATLPPAARAGLEVDPPGQDLDYALTHILPAHRTDLAFNSVYDAAVYNNRVISVKPLDAVRMTPAAIAAYGEIYGQAIAGEAFGRADYDLYLAGRTLTFIKERCRPGDLSGAFSAKVFAAYRSPGRAADYPAFVQLTNRGVRLGERCLAVIQLPDYPIAQISAEQYSSNEAKVPAWQVSLRFTPPGLAELAAELRDGKAGPTAGAAFELFRQDGLLVYYRQPCRRVDTTATIRLQVIPQRAADLPPERRDYGFDSLDFPFFSYGTRFGGQCLAMAPLPDYPIAEIRTGQAGLWEFAGLPPIADNALRRAAAALAGAPPAARAGGFDLYRRSGELIYRRESCAAADTAAGFFLHIIPQDDADLPAERREDGFDNRDFAFEQWGGYFDGQCLAAVPLPDYPIAALHTGQYVPDAGELWRGELAGGGPRRR